MKTYLLIILTVLTFSLTCNAQTEKGAKMIGGSGYFTFGERVNGGLTPSFGYFLKEDFVLGAGLPFNFSRTASDSFFSTALSPFVRYYFGQPGSTRVFAHAMGSVGFMYTRTSWEGGPTVKDTSPHNSLAGGIGVVHFVTEQVGLEAQVVYNNYQLSNSPRIDELGLRFGIQIHLPGSSKK